MTLRSYRLRKYSERISYCGWAVGVYDVMISQDNTNPVVVSCLHACLETLRRIFYLNMIFSAGSTLKVVPNKTVFKTKIIYIFFFYENVREME